MLVKNLSKHEFYYHYGWSQFINICLKILHFIKLNKITSENHYKTIMAQINNNFGALLVCYNPSHKTYTQQTGLYFFSHQFLHHTRQMSG